eukprot:g5014.t1
MTLFAKLKKDIATASAFSQATEAATAACEFANDAEKSLNIAIIEKRHREELKAAAAAKKADEELEQAAIDWARQHADAAVKKAIEEKKRALEAKEMSESLRELDDRVSTSRSNLSRATTSRSEWESGRESRTLTRRERSKTRRKRRREKKISYDVALQKRKQHEKKEKERQERRKLDANRLQLSIERQREREAMLAKARSRISAIMAASAAVEAKFIANTCKQAVKAAKKKYLMDRCKGEVKMAAVASASAARFAFKCSTTAIQAVGAARAKLRPSLKDAAYVAKAATLAAKRAQRLAREAFQRCLENNKDLQRRHAVEMSKAKRHIQTAALASAKAAASSACTVACTFASIVSIGAARFADQQAYKAIEVFNEALFEKQRMDEAAALAAGNAATISFYSSLYASKLCEETILSVKKEVKKRRLEWREAARAARTAARAAARAAIFVDRVATYCNAEARLLSEIDAWREVYDSRRGSFYYVHKTKNEMTSTKPRALILEDKARLQLIEYGMKRISRDRNFSDLSNNQKSKVVTLSDVSLFLRKEVHPDWENLSAIGKYRCLRQAKEREALNEKRRETVNAFLSKVVRRKLNKKKTKRRRKRSPTKASTFGFTFRSHGPPVPPNNALSRNKIDMNFIKSQIKILQEEKNVK